MSHYSVLVIGDNLEQDLAPYDENTSVDPYRDYIDLDPTKWPLSALQDDNPELFEDWTAASHLLAAEALNERWGENYEVDEQGIYQTTTYNKDSKWDYWRVGGRWAGHWTLKPGSQGTLEDLSWEWGFRNSDDPPLPDFSNRADVALKVDIDFDRMRQDAVDKAADEYDRFTAVVDSVGPLPDDSWREGPWNDSKEASRDAYWNHPTVKALRDAGLLGWTGWPSEMYGVDRNTYIERARLEAITTYALVYEGKWIEPGAMGWWGMSSDTEESRNEYAKKFNELIDSLPDDTTLTVVDCHI